MIVRFMLFGIELRVLQLITKYLERAAREGGWFALYIGRRIVLSKPDIPHVGDPASRKVRFLT